MAAEYQPPALASGWACLANHARLPAISELPALVVFRLFHTHPCLPWGPSTARVVWEVQCWYWYWYWCWCRAACCPVPSPVVSSPEHAEAGRTTTIACSSRRYCVHKKHNNTELTPGARETWRGHPRLRSLIGSSCLPSLQSPSLPGTGEEESRWNCPVPHPPSGSTGPCCRPNGPEPPSELTPLGHDVHQAETC